MNLAVVIPALHEADRIHEAVSSALAPGVDVVVVDGGSRDATRDRAREAGARVIQSEPGRARQLAEGARATSASALLFLHADSVLPSGYSQALRGALDDPRVVGGAFALRFERVNLGALERAAMALVEWGVRVRVALFGLPYGDQAIFARRSVLEALGGVPQVPILEDVDLVRGLKRHGRLARLPDAVTTSPRRYLERGPLRVVARNLGILLADRCGADRARLAAWYRR